MAFAPGEKIGNLHVECELGAGSFATVYRARDELVGRTVAVKVLHPPARSAVPVDRERVLGEARVVGALSSPHVVTLYGVRELADGGFAFEMEYVDGGSLEDLLERESRPAREDVIRILGGILRGLEAAHRDGILHLDVKPANVLLGADGSVKLGDFGVAGNLGEGGLESVTGGALRGTPQYMAPEVFHEEPVTVATDLWSVGIVLYRMLCGRLPFTGGLPALFYAVPYAEPEALGPDVDSNLGGLALRCLAKAPEDRPASCSDLLEILERIASAPQAPAPPRPAVVQARGPLVGRARELRRLEGLAARAEAGDGGTVVVSGEGGIGKTRLLQELRRRTQHGGFRWLDATLGPVGGLQGALLEAVRRGLHPGPTATVGAAWVTTARFGPAAGVLRKLLAGDEGAHPDRSSYVMWALEQLLLGLAGEGPVGVLIEEARLAGVEDHRLLRGLSARLAGQRILLTLAIRTHDAHTEEEPGRALLAALAGLPHVVRMDLGPLPASDVYDILGLESGDRNLAPEVLDLVLRRAGGNPLYVTELYRHLVGTGAVVVFEGRVEPGPAWRTAAVPPRLRDVIVRRLAALDAEERALLESAAVDGVSFDANVLAEVLGRPLLDVLRSLQWLYRTQRVVEPLPSGFRFAHALFQEVLYRDIAPDLRRELHRRIADDLERLPSERAPEAERVGIHWEQAGEIDRAAPYLRGAAATAAARQQYVHALELAERGGLLPGPTAPEETRAYAHVLFGLAGVLMDLGRLDDAEGIVQRVFEAAGALEDDMLRARALVWQGDVEDAARGAGGLDRNALQEAIRTLPEDGDHARAHFLLGKAAGMSGEREAVRHHLERAEAVCRIEGLSAFRATVLQRLAGERYLDGDLEEALRLSAEAARMSAAVGKRMNAAVSEIYRIRFAVMLGKDEDAEAAMRGAIRDIEMSGAAPTAVHATVYLAALQIALGRRARALETLEGALRRLEREPLPLAQVEALLLRGRLDLISGDLDRACRTLAEAAELARDLGDAASESQALGSETLRLCLAARPQAAAAIVHEALERIPEAMGREARADLAGILVEAVVFSLPVGLLDEVVEGMGPPSSKEGPTLRLSRRIADGARALASPSAPPGPLRDASEALRDPIFGMRRAEARLPAALFDVEALRREGKADEALAVARRGLEEARALGHVGYEGALLRLVLHLRPDPEDERAYDALAERVAGGLAHEEAREGLLSAWREGTAFLPQLDVGG